MTTGRFVPLAAVTTAMVSSTLLLLAPACGTKGNADCGESCAPVEGVYPLVFQPDAGLPPECANLNAPPLPDGKDLTLTRDGGALGGSLEGVALRGQVFPTGDLTVSGAPPPSSDGGLTLFISVSATFTGGASDGGSLTGTFSGNFSRIQGSGSLQCTVTRPFTATRR
ncbi:MULTISPECIES: hypothetical protein [Corallococcus]|uniref:hypothetical protein n=1 Tax=Corallococcus TaxID=83461 RepID=UPI00117E54F7|nr:MULTISPECIES: hypothetical protein [Corallococcus]NBD12125.1 hypothetical protein [Corallococcus silvisoli]TSC21644.1 hypothetical protein FOF48_34035 [Corallococcus sp. Z5C101001]